MSRIRFIVVVEENTLCYKKGPKGPIYLDAAVCPKLDKWIRTTTRENKNGGA